MKKLFIKLSGVLFASALFLVMGVIYLRVYHLERDVPNYAIEQWVEENEINKVLVVFAHQDDELLVAGTLSGLDAAGIETALLTVTNGDGERLSEGQSVEQLVSERAAELQAVADVLRMEAVEQGFFSDKYFMDVPEADIKQVILEKIHHYKPDTIITNGAGNYAVVSSEALTILQSATTSAFARSTEGVFEAPTNTKFVGTLNNSMRVYVDGYAATGTDVLVGYKGSSEADAPAFYCPYIPLMSSGVVLDPATFEPVVGFLTRYGYVELTNTASSLGNAADYLARISISNVSFK